MVLKVGEIAPDVVLTSHMGVTIRLSEFRGKKNVALIFFPLAWTPI